MNKLLDYTPQAARQKYDKYTGGIDRILIFPRIFYEP